MCCPCRRAPVRLPHQPTTPSHTHRKRPKTHTTATRGRPTWARRSPSATSSYSTAAAWASATIQRTAAACGSGCAALCGVFTQRHSTSLTFLSAQQRQRLFQTSILNPHPPLPPHTTKIAAAAKAGNWSGRYNIHVGGYDDAHVEGEYTALLARSVYCLVAAGDGWSARFDDAMLHGWCGARRVEGGISWLVVWRAGSKRKLGSVLNSLLNH